MFDLIEYSDPERRRTNLRIWAVIVIWALVDEIFERSFHRSAEAVFILPLLFAWVTNDSRKRMSKYWASYVCEILWIMSAIMIAVGGWLHWWLAWICLIVSTVVLFQLEQILKSRARKRVELGDVRP
jgi:hypothetical protein